MKKKKQFVDMYSKIDIFVFRMFLIICKFMGLAPFSYKITTKVQNTTKATTLEFFYSKIFSLYTIILSLFCFSIIYIFFPFYYHGHQADSFQVPLTTTLFVGRYVAIAVLQLYFVFHQGEIVTIFNRLAHIDVKLSKKFTLKHDQTNKKGFKTLTIVLYISINIINLMTEFIHPPDRWYFSMSIIGVFVLGLPMLQYNALLNYIRVNIACLNKSCELIGEPASAFNDNTILVTTIHPPMIMQNILLIRQAQRNYYEVLHDITNIYSTPALLYSGLGCTAFIYSSYDLVTEYFENSSYQIPYLMHSSFWIMSVVFPIVIVTDAVTRLKNEVCNSI